MSKTAWMLMLGIPLTLAGLSLLCCGGVVVVTSMMKPHEPNARCPTCGRDFWIAENLHPNTEAQDSQCAQCGARLPKWVFRRTFAQGEPGDWNLPVEQQMPAP